MPFDFSAVSAPFRMQPGLRRIAPGTQQLTPSRTGSRAMSEKLEVLSAFAEQALVSEPGFDPAPALRALCHHAADEHPDAFGFDDASSWHAKNLRWSLFGTELRGDGDPVIGECLRKLPAHWRLPGLLALAFEQDFAVLDARTGRISWSAVCLPSHWAPQDKVGRHFAEVHAPVADNRMLLAASDALIQLVAGPERWERFVWTLSADPQLQQHPQRKARIEWPAHADAGTLAGLAHFRTEHQTFIPLPAERQAVFTIHVESSPLVVAVNSPERAAAVRAALDSMSPAVLNYRGLTEAQARLSDWLARREVGAVPTQR